jgi:hypothetical protein
MAKADRSDIDILPTAIIIAIVSEFSNILQTAVVSEPDKPPPKRVVTKFSQKYEPGRSGIGAWVIRIGSCVAATNVIQIGSATIRTPKISIM